MIGATRSVPARQRDVPGSVDHVVVLEAVFDAGEARALETVLDGLPEGALALDFSRCTDVRDRGLSVLAELLARRDRPAALRGLRSHQRRLLRYLGLEAA
jgi:hypothetical protein